MAIPIITEQAEDEVNEASAYLMQHSPSAAEELMDSFYEKASIHAGQPGLGRNRDDLKKGLKSFVVGKYVAYFRPVDGTIEVLRFLFGARDINSIFHSDE